MNNKCVLCDKELDGDDLICQDCLGKERQVTCENCGREFWTGERDYELLLDACPYCGKDNND